jgi:hypothetical protein
MNDARIFEEEMIMSKYHYQLKRELQGKQIDYPTAMLKE